MRIHTKAARWAILAVIFFGSSLRSEDEIISVAPIDRPHAISKEIVRFAGQFTDKTINVKVNRNHFYAGFPADSNHPHDPGIPTTKRRYPAKLVANRDRLFATTFIYPYDCVVTYDGAREMTVAKDSPNSIKFVNISSKPMQIACEFSPIAIVTGQTPWMIRSIDGEQPMNSDSFAERVAAMNWEDVREVEGLGEVYTLHEAKRTPKGFRIKTNSWGEHYFYFAVRHGFLVWVGEDVISTSMLTLPPIGEHLVVSKSKLRVTYDSQGKLIIPISFEYSATSDWNDLNGKQLYPTKLKFDLQSQVTDFALLDDFPDEILKIDIPEGTKISDFSITGETPIDVRQISESNQN